MPEDKSRIPSRGDFGRAASMLPAFSWEAELGFRPGVPVTASGPARRAGLREELRDQ